MEPSLYHDYRQRPITSDEACTHFQHYLAQIEAMITVQEDMVVQAREQGNTSELARARTSLWRLLTKRQGVIDAIIVYTKAQIYP